MEQSVSLLYLNIFTITIFFTYFMDIFLGMELLGKGYLDIPCTGTCLEWLWASCTCTGG